MTNAEKYLKDHVIYMEFANDLAEYIINSGRIITDKHDIKIETLNFLSEEVKPTLTDDERVILKNMIPQVKTIGRDTDGELIIKICSDTIAEDFCYSGAFIYDHLFQFIKNGEEYEIEELLKGE